MKNFALGIIAMVLMLTFVYLFFELVPEKSEMVTSLQQYIHPHNKSVKGNKFKLSLYNYNLAMQLMVQLENGKKVKVLTMDSLIEATAPVTAVSSNHLEELLKHLDNFQQFVPKKKLIVYDLGLTGDEVYTLKKIDYVEYRKFDFSVYPKHVRNLDSYAWKPLIIQQVLAEQGGVMWMDSSVNIMKPYTKVLEHMVNNSSGFLYYLVPNGHSILSATHPKMFEYLPMKNVNETKMMQPQANGFLVFNTLETRKFIFKWVILCSLVQDCIAPKGSTKRCQFKSSVERNAGGCHRYDQSMFSILLTNKFSPDTERYIMEEKIAVADRLSLSFNRKVVIFLKTWIFKGYSDIISLYA